MYCTYVSGAEIFRQEMWDVQVACQEATYGNQSVVWLGSQLGLTTHARLADVNVNVNVA